MYGYGAADMGWIEQTERWDGVTKGDIWEEGHIEVIDACEEERESKRIDRPRWPQRSYTVGGQGGGILSLWSVSVRRRKGFQTKELQVRMVVCVGMWKCTINYMLHRMWVIYSMNGMEPGRFMMSQTVWNHHHDSSQPCLLWKGWWDRHWQTR